MQKIINISVILFLFFGGSLLGETGFFYPGEELVYEVSFLGLSLGEVKIITVGPEIINSKEMYHIMASLKTYDNIPFMKANVAYDSWIDKSANCSYKLEARITHDKTKKELFVTTLKYPLVAFTKYINKKITEEKAIIAKGKLCEGLALLFLMRKLSNTDRSIIIPTIMGYDTSTTKLSFGSKKYNIEIDASDKKISSYTISGKGNWTGVYGVTGDFKAWFSADDARIPLKAQLKLYIGMVNIELKQWKRKSWIPPPAN